jgi:cell division protein FtsB
MLERFARSLAPKVLATLLLFLALWIGHVAAQGAERSKRIELEVASLEAEAARMEKENVLLKEKIGYLQTDGFQEEEAKEKLNYQNPQEKVVVIRPRPGPEDEHPEESLPPEPGEDPRPNYKKWWDRFFRSPSQDKTSFHP